MPVVFRVSAPLAMFRKWWTTSSSVSYPFPTPTAVAGLIGAILGFEKGDTGSAYYWEHLKGSQISILIERYRYMNMGINFLNTKTWDGHTQIMHQFVRDGSYVVFYKGSHERMLGEYIRKGWSIYTPYMGVAYALVKPEFIGVYEEEEVSERYVDTVFPARDNVPDMDIVKSGGIQMEKMNYKSDIDRRRGDMVQVFYAPPGKKIVFKDAISLSRVGPYLVKWFPEW